MKKDVKATANALAVVAAAYYIFCLAFLAITPDFFMGIYSSWFHGVNISQITTTKLPQPLDMLWGLITFTVFAWISGFLFAWIYNYFVKEK